MTPLNLQNLHPRFKSGRRLQVFSSEFDGNGLQQHNPGGFAIGLRWTTNQQSATLCRPRKSLIENGLIVERCRKGWRFGEPPLRERIPSRLVSLAVRFRTSRSHKSSSDGAWRRASRLAHARCHRGIRKL